MKSLDEISNAFAALAPAGVAWSLRLVEQSAEHWAVRQDVAQPPRLAGERGAFVSLSEHGGMGYAATSDLSLPGLQAACEQARAWARASRAHQLLSVEDVPSLEAHAYYRTPVSKAWSELADDARIELLTQASRALHIDEAVVDWQAMLARRHSHQLLSNHEGARIEQRFDFIHSGLFVAAHRDGQTQTRSGGGWGGGRQGGLEQLPLQGFPDEAGRIAEQALRLLDAPQCPSGKMDILLMPSQMVLQIHESIGHPLEIDRILGDERNYAGTSFVRPEMFGEYRYGSELLNVTFDPSHPEQLASYAYDDEGSQAKREYIIRDGILERGLGGAVSQTRSRLPGVANARASGWNRPPIDRMANLNVEPGDKSLAQLIAGIEHGVLMDSNRSWSIDDSRNKFQFGCEWGQLIENGELKEPLRNPNYRGISANFWRNLAAVGDRSTFDVQGTPFCGKGEPNQMIHVGHASPACVFRDVEVFGGAA